MSQSDTIEWLRAKLTGPEGVLDIVARSSQIPAVVASGSASQAGSAATPRALVKSHAPLSNISFLSEAESWLAGGA
jgi:hypothetical protein